MPNEKKRFEIDKEFKLTSLCLNNRNSVMLMTVIIVIIGLMSYINLPKENFPDIKRPIIYVGTSYPGNSPIDIENLITREIEKELNTISEVDEIKSTSIQDYSTIVVDFDPDMDIENALTKVKDAVDRAKPELPNDLPSDPNIFELNFSDFPIMNINLSGGYSIEELKEFAEYLEDEIEKIPEISKAEIRGIEEKEVKIKVNPYMIEARNINFGDIENAVRGENVTLSGGNIIEDGTQRSVRIVGEFTDPKQIENIVIKREKGNIVYLKDVAKVEFDYKDRESYARLEGYSVVMVDVIKKGGENLLLATDQIAKIIEDAKANVFPKGLKVTITNDQSSSTREMVSNLENNIISGVIVVVFVLLLFMGTRNALFVGMAIPMSMFISFLLLNILGITVNTIVLFALIMALGMLVDNGIVVVENIYRLREEGYKLLEAAKLGVGEVAMPIISSTATTLAAFIPLAMWPGMIGEFMKYLPITLIIALGSSLFVALVINPVLISLFMKLNKDIRVSQKKVWIMSIILIAIGITFIITGNRLVGNIMVLFALLTILNVYVFVPLSKSFQKNVLPYLEKQYSKLIAFALRGKNPIIFFLGTTVIFIFSFSLLGIFKPKTLFFPISQPSLINILIEFPIGTDIDKTDRFTEKIEQQTFELIKPYKDIVESIVTTVGTGASTDGGLNETPNRSRITLKFVDFKYRNGINTADVMAHVRNGMFGYAGVSVTVEQNKDGPATGKPISIEVIGEDFEQLLSIVDRMKDRINQSDIQGIERLQTDVKTGKPEMILNIDREKARRFGVSTYSIANEVRTSLFGKEISKFKQGEDDYKIQLRLDDNHRYNLNALIDKNITFRNNINGKMHQVPISSLVSTELSSTYGSIKRKDLKRVVTINSNVLGGFNATVINDKIKTLLSDFSMPPGYSFRFGGEQEEQAEEMAFLSRALLFALFTIFLIIVAQFNKVSVSIIIMTSVLFSTIGVLLGLIIFQMDFIIIMTMIGIISLAGVVVNNSIVLVDFVELKQKRLRKELGTNKLPMDRVVEMVIEAGKIRLRPVLLTAITTVLGLIPLAIGINIDFMKFFTEYEPDFYIGGENVVFWGPLSWTVIHGLVIATFLTLIVIPVMYILTERISRRVSNIFSKQ